jgi:4-hydroxythreonine-4-phosphate dehydrogenase
MNGIGPEVVLKAIKTRTVQSVCRPLLVGPWSVFRHHAIKLGADTPSLFVSEPGEPAMIRISPGDVSAAAGRIAGEAIRHGVALVLGGFADALVTAPVSKTALQKGGVQFPGQTEFLQHLTRSRKVAMILVAGAFRVGLLTIHVPIRKVAELLTRSRVSGTVRTIHEALVTDWGIKTPRLAILGLNPHAGEGGQIGNEERRILIPAVKDLRRRGISINGPFPADAFFARGLQRQFDAVVAAYHDQGLIPLKVAAGGRGVNVSAGLPIIRTSPDHGTGFDIAGKGIADAGSMIEAIRTAVDLSQRRKRHRAR